MYVYLVFLVFCERLNTKKVLSDHISEEGNKLELKKGKILFSK